MKATEIVAVITIVMVTLGCASKPAPAQQPTQQETQQAQSKSPEQVAREEATERARPIRTMPEGPPPEWLSKIPVSPITQYFVGSAGRYAVETGNTGSRFYAEANGRTQLAQYYSTLIEDKARSYAATFGLTGDTLSPQVIGQQLNVAITRNVVRELAPVEYYTEVFLDATNRQAYQSFVLMTVDRKTVQRELDNYGKQQAEEHLRKAAAEQDQALRIQHEKAASFFGGNLTSSLLGDIQSQ